MKTTKYYIIFILFSLTLISLINASTYSDCNIYGNCKTSNNFNSNTNYSLVNVNNSQYLQGYTPFDLPYVPYQGANQNVNLSYWELYTGMVHAGNLEFGGSPAGAGIHTATGDLIIDVLNERLYHNYRISYDWGNGIIYDSASMGAININYRALDDINGKTSINWGNRYFNDNKGIDGIQSLDWNGRQLVAGDGVTAILQWNNSANFTNNNISTTGDIYGSNIFGNNICYSNGSSCQADTSSLHLNQDNWILDNDWLTYSNPVLGFNLTKMNDYCLSNGTNCVPGGNSSFNQSLTDTLYYPINLNPNGYFNSTTLNNISQLSNDANYLTITGNGSQLTGVSKIGASSLFKTNSSIAVSVSTTYKMMGLGNQINMTPLNSGIIKFHIDAYTSTTSSSPIANYKISYGTGTPPSQSASANGTVVGTTTQISASGTFSIPFSKEVIVSGLSTGTNYWFDVQVSSNSISPVTVTTNQIEATLQELPY
jgi:hypothetical protein